MNLKTLSSSTALAPRQSVVFLVPIQRNKDIAGLQLKCTLSPQEIALASSPRCPIHSVLFVVNNFCENAFKASLFRVALTFNSLSWKVCKIRRTPSIGALKTSGILVSLISGSPKVSIAEKTHRDFGSFACFGSIAEQSQQPAHTYASVITSLVYTILSIR